MLSSGQRTLWGGEKSGQSLFLYLLFPLQPQARSFLAGGAERDPGGAQRDLLALGGARAREGNSATGPATSSREFPLQQLVHLGWIRLAPRRLHHLPHEETEHLLFAAPVLRYLLLVPGHHLVNDLLQRALIRHLRQPLGLDDLGRALSRMEHLFQHRLCNRPAHLALALHDQQFGQSLRFDRALLVGVLLDGPWLGPAISLGLTLMQYAKQFNHD